MVSLKEADQQITPKKAPPTVFHPMASSQISSDELTCLKDLDIIENQKINARGVPLDEKILLNSPYSRVGSFKIPSSQHNQQKFEETSVADGAKPFSQNTKNDNLDENYQISQVSLQNSESSTACDANAETKNPFSSSPIKYVLSYRESNGTQFKDQIVRNVKSLEPMHDDQHTQGEGIIEVNRIIWIRDMQIDFTKPLAEQCISVSQFGPQQIRINSIAIINALHSVVHYWPHLNLNTSSLSILEPFAILYHHREALQDYANSKRSNAAQKDFKGCEREKNLDTHLELLFDFLGSCPEVKKIDMERERHNRSRPTVTFEMLWLLFPPGTDAFYDIVGDGILSGFVVGQTSGGGLAMDRTAPFDICLWYLDYDGDHIGRRLINVTIQPFTGEKEVSTLSVIPCDYYKRITAGVISDESRLLRQTIVGYGKKFLELTKRQYVHHSGEVLNISKPWYHGRVFVDMEGYYRDFPNRRPELDEVEGDEIVPIRQCACSYCGSNVDNNNLLRRHYQFSGYDKIRPNASDFFGLTDHQKFVCDFRVWGFDLNARVWYLCNVPNITYCKWNKSLIDSQLSIHDGDRNMIKGLVGRYLQGQSSESASNEPWKADFILSKGYNMIFLLHGKPGVGKTFTAECVAEFVQRPLLPLNCADLGVKSDVVESNLESYFQKAKKWGAILLLDEADVYLEQRTSRDLERNCLVATFLRCLEYYQGILFLTTNRVGTFDDALVSRINVILHYEFDEPKRQDVWDTFFRKLEHERGQLIKVPYSTREYCRHDPDLRRLEWNGREIRNAFQTAVALAEYTEEPDPADGLITLRDVHFQHVVRMSSNFARYLRKVHGAETEKVAANRGDRNEYSKQRNAT